jgi:nucleoside-diphosphate-sugar epimerase
LELYRHRGLSPPMPHQRVLVTGATGIVGCELVRTLLRSANPPQIFALLRGSHDEVEKKRRWICEWSGVERERADCLVALRGEMTLPGLGVGSQDQAVARSVTGILHAGAVTRFDQTPEAARINNVVSARNILEHARHCPQLTRIGVVSTVFVAGRRGGTIREADLDLQAHFNNEYERSKAHAEYEARLSMRKLPIDVYRLSIVVGRRMDGHISRLSGIYPVFRLFHAGLLAMFPGSPGQRVDLIPADFAAEAVLHLFAGSTVPGVTYHVCAGPDRSFGLDEICPALDACFAADAAWRSRGQPLPLTVTADVFSKFVSVVELTGNPKLQHIIRQTRTLTQQLEIAKTYDSHEFNRAIADSRTLQLGHVREWLPQIVAHGMALGWQSPARYLAS